MAGCIWVMSPQQTGSTDPWEPAPEELLPGSVEHQHGPQNTSAAGGQQAPYLISNETVACLWMSPEAVEEAHHISLVKETEIIHSNARKVWGGQTALLWIDGTLFPSNETEETQQMCAGVVEWKINNLESNAVFCLHGAVQTDQEQPATATDKTRKVLLDVFKLL